jgi:hypothetical protein
MHSCHKLTAKDAHVTNQDTLQCISVTAITKHDSTAPIHVSTEAMQIPVTHTHAENLNHVLIVNHVNMSRQQQQQLAGAASAAGSSSNIPRQCSQCAADTVIYEREYCTASGYPFEA